MKSKFLLAMALVFVVAASFTTIGMAYSSSTENTGNTASSEYVVLTQSNYTLTGDSSLIIDAVTMPVGTFYQLPCCEDLFTYDNRHYCGVKVGDSDTLEADAVGSAEETVIPVRAETYYTGSGQNISTGFTDFSNSSLGWRYVIMVKVSAEEETTGDIWEGVPRLQYLYYDGNKTPDGDGLILWKVLVPGELGVFEEAEHLSIVEGAKYETSLYLAGIAQTVADGSVLRLPEKTVTLSEDVMVTPFWVQGGQGDLINTLQPGDSGIIGQPDRILYVQRGENLVVPSNQFNCSDGKVFVGWYETGTMQYYYPGDIFKDYDESRFFVAQWSTSGHKTITLTDGVVNSEVSPIENYVIGGRNYTFPLNKFVNGNKMFVGWEDSSTGDVYQPGDSLTINANKSFSAVWDNLGTCKKVTINGTIRHTAVTFELYTDSDGNFTLPDNMLGPAYELPDEGWKFLGWFVKEGNKTGRLAAQYVTAPNASVSKIINNGTVKFAYDGDEVLQEVEG